MKHWHRSWPPALSGRLPSLRLAARGATLLLLVGLLTTSALVLRPVAQAHPTTARALHARTVPLHALDTPTPRLETFVVAGGTIYHKWSDTNGAPGSWTSWVPLAGLANGLPFVGTPAVVSDEVGRLTVVARDSNDALWSNTYIADLSGPGSGWRAVPGTSGLHVFIGGQNYGIDSDPAVSSWGPGRLDLFLNVQSVTTGAKATLHTWAENDTWSGTWEVVGTLFALGNPAAVSQGPGQVGVFIQNGSDELRYKVFSNGQWECFRCWGEEDHLVSSPAVISTDPSEWDVFALSPTNGLASKEYSAPTWYPWHGIDTNTISSAPAAVTTPGYVHVFALGTNGSLLYRNRLSSDHSDLSWSGWVDLNGGGALPDAPAAVAWDPVPFVVPNVLSLDQASATAAITGAGLVLGSVTPDNTCTDVAGTVLQQDPIGGAVVVPGSAVNLRVSSGLDSRGRPCIFR